MFAVAFVIVLLLILNASVPRLALGLLALILIVLLFNKWDALKFYFQ